MYNDETMSIGQLCSIHLFNQNKTKTMKNSSSKLMWIAFLFYITIGSISRMQAQSTEFGIRFMPAFTKFDIITSTGGTIVGDIDASFGIGAHLGYNFSDQVGLQAEVIYNKFSQKFKESDVEHNIDLSYVNIPLLLALNTSKSKAFNLGVVLGPQIGLSVGSKLANTNTNPNLKVPVLSVKSTDFGFAYGAGIDFGLNTEGTVRLGLGFRGVHGLIDISDNSATITENSYYILDRTKLKVYSGYLGISFLF
jgi:opacity protein-like surface antigen